MFAPRSRAVKKPMPPETSKLKHREIEADTFVQAFLQNMGESQRTLSLVTYHKVRLGSFRLKAHLRAARETKSRVNISVSERIVVD